MDKKGSGAKKAQKGPPFISDPGVLVFRDFIVGEKMNIPFTLTNVSFGRNTYKILGFDKEYEALFHLNFSPPGYVSPGVPIPLSLDFTPKYNTPIRCALHCLAETGPFDVPVECLPKIVNIQIEPFDVFDLGVVTLGEEIEQTLTIRNSGALNAVWSLSLESQGNEPGYISLQEAEDGVIQFSSRHGTVSGYGSAQVRVTFRPARPGQLRFSLRFKFSSHHGEFDSFFKELPLEGVASDVPVFLENDKIDLGVCYYNELYRATLVAHNRSNLSQRFVIQLPPNLEKFVEFMPKLGFIQPQSSLQITIKVRTTNKFASTFPQYERTAEIPIVMEVVNQVLPVNFSLSFTPSSLKLAFDPPALDFGTFLATECKEVPLRITSSMQLPCNFGFIRLPNGVSVRPFDGFGLIMPGETVEVYVTFQSPIPKKHEFPITIATLQGQKFTVPCTGTVVTPPLQLSATNIEFEATPLGQEASYKLMLTNTRTVPLDFEMENTEDFLLDPVVSTIPPGSSVPVFITFRPTVPTQQPEKPQEEEQPVANPKKDAKKDAKKSKSHNKEKKKPEELETVDLSKEIVSSDFTYKIYEKSVACFYRTGNATGRHHIMVKAAAVLPTLYVTGVTINKNERRSDDYIDLSLNKINFGVVCTGQSMDAIIDIRSVIKRSLRLEYICERGSFEVLSPSTVVKPLQTTQLRVRFAPSANMKFTSKVTIFCPDRPNTRIVLQLTGEGAAPSIALSQDTLDFGHVVVGHTVTRSVKVKNNANFALEYVYELKPTDQMHCKNMSGSESFGIVKRSQWLKPQETGEALVTFSPDHDDLNFQTVLIISAGEAGESREVPVSAASWPHVMFIMGGSEEPRQRTAFDHYALDEPYFRPNVLCEMSYPGAGAQTTLTFGVCNQNDDVKKTNGDVTFDNIQTPGFTVTPPKSAVEAGGMLKVTIDYAPPASSLLQVGQWVVADTAVNIKCADFAMKVPVRLKCLINLQQAADLSQAASTRQSKSTAKRKSRK